MDDRRSISAVLMTSFKEDYRHVRFGIGMLLIALAVASASVCAAPATPEHPFSGRWRMDTTSLKGDVKPTTIMLVDGDFQKDDNESIKADGRLHHVSGDLYVDEQSISVESDHVVKEVDKIRGKLAYTVEYRVSLDGKTLTSDVGNYANPNGQAVKSVAVYRRVGLPTKGAHLISGTWNRVSVSADAKSDWILKLDGNRFSWRREDGTGYDAIIGGESVKIDGDNSGARALITRPRPDIIVETGFSAEGKFDDDLSMQLMPDQNTIRCVVRTRSQKKPTTFYLHRIAE